MIRISVGLPFLLIAAGLFAQDEKPFNKEHHPWLKFKQGSSVKMTMTLNGEKTDMKHILTEVSKEGFTTSQETSIFGSVDVFKDKEKFPTRAGEETLKIDEKEYKCTIWKSSAERHGGEAESKYWIDGEGRLLRMEKSLYMYKGTLSVQAVKLDEKVKVKGKEYACINLVGTCQAPTGGEAIMAMWMSREIPGGVAKSRMSYKGGGGPVVSVDLAVVEFDVKK